MANKYIIHGATYCGDGTASNEAASAGAAGAWNNINVFEGTAPAYGTLAAGDTVYIRSKDASGADITRTLSASVNLGSTSATVGSPITWILDNGSIWSGVSGTLTYTTGSTSYTMAIRAYNTVVASAADALILKSTVTSPAGGSYLVSLLGAAVNVKFDWSAKTNSNDVTPILWANGAYLENPHVVVGASGTSSGYNNGLIAGGNYATLQVLVVINPNIEIGGSNVGQAVFHGGSSSLSKIIVCGGKVSGTGTTTGSNLCSIGSASKGVVSIVGLSFPRTMNVCSTYIPQQLDIVGCDDSFGGFTQADWGWATSRTDNNPPTLEGTLPDAAATKWALRVYPSAASVAVPMVLRAAKAFTDTAATKTITQEVLVSTDFTTQPNKSTLWMVVDYVDDSTGLKKTISTRDYSASALDASTANWSATTWGMVSFNKRKLEVTTPTAIKADTPITVSVISTLPSPSANAIYFVDSDFGIA